MVESHCPGNSDASLRTARACKKARAKASVPEGSQDGSGSRLTGRDVDAELQIASAFLPGRVAAAHIQTVARHLLQVASSIAVKCSLMADAAGALTQEMGDTWHTTHGSVSFE